MSKRIRMAAYFRILLLTTTILITGCRKSTDGPDSDAEITISDPFEINGRLGRGVNLGNALEAPSEGVWGVVLEAAYFKLIAEAGFHSVRIPVRWSAHASQTAPYAIDPAFMARVDWAVDQALANGLMVVVNIHHYEEIMSVPATHKVRLLGLWEQIASHYSGYSDSLVLEILNEPHDQLTPELWNSYLAEALQVIRKSNPGRTVIIGTAEWSGVGSLAQLVVPESDRNLIVTVHYYNPFHFTHQGAEWVEGSNPWLGTTWSGTAAENSAVINDLDRVANWADTHQRPVFLGEFGAYSKADMDSRVRWTSFMARQAEARDMSWAYWEFCAGFGIYDRDQQVWRGPLLEALIPPG